MTPEQEAQRATDSPAPAGAPGRWVARAALPIPRSEMAWATATQGRMHVVGGYGEGAVNRDYHHVYDPAGDRWLSGAPLPRGANHVAVASEGGRVWALGGFIEQNRRSDDKAFVYDTAADRWTAIAPLPRPRGAAAAVMLDGMLHLIGGASEPAAERASVGWHEVYDPQVDRWSARKPLPGARDHVGCVAHNGQIHVIGGRFNTFEYNTELHHVYLPARDTWELRAPLPTARSGHGLVVYRDRLYAMGGEGGFLVGGVPRQAKVFGQMESYDPRSDRWQRHAPMLTPRHAVGAAVIGDWIYVAGGGAVLGGSVQSAVHEAFTLG
jgi:N-acetylneuraminic acid mutarotase